MKHLPDVYESLRFLLIDLQIQLQSVIDGIREGDKEYFDKSLTRIDYIENAHVNLLNRSFKIRTVDEQIPLQSYEHISYSLKNLSTQLETLSLQLKSCSALKLLQKKKIFQALESLAKGLSLIEPAIESDKLTFAIDICQLESRIEKACSEQIKRYQEELKSGQNSRSLMQSILIFKDIEYLGHSLLKVGEGLLSGKLGQFIQIDRYQTLEATLSELDLDLHATEQRINIHSMGETKSGCTISGITSASEVEQEILAIFKEGKKEKLLEEKIGIESWHQKFPGIAPEVYSYQKQGDKAALLFEYLNGQTFDKLLRDERETLKAGLGKLFETLIDIWQTTQQPESVAPNFMKQLRKRLNTVYRVHPDFNVKSKGLRIGETKQLSLEDLIKHAEQIEKTLKVPKAVYIHGDFNVDNILFDPESNNLNFIDLHRSEYMDYTQDLSVLIVSFYRLKEYDPHIRQRIRLTMEAIYDFGLDYAESIDDQDYKKRMALGLARSFISSTRFVLDRDHAKQMLFKGRFLLEQLITLTKKQQKKYELPKEIFHD